MSSKIKVGDRIAVYHLTFEGLELDLERIVGYVLNITPNGVIEFEIEGAPIVGTAHPKQCRKLVLTNAL